MAFIDFNALKERVSFGEAASYLSLRMKQSGNQWRGPCPSCAEGGDRALVITEGKGFFCFAMNKGGDVIALASHVLDLPPKQAAEELAKRAGIVPSNGNSTCTVPVPERERESDRQTFAPLSYLEPEHEAVIAVGFDPEFAKGHGIGWAGKGVARGHVLIPFRDERGTLLGYIGVTDAWLPSAFRTNVVPFKKTG